MNKSILVGRLTRDPELRTTTTGKSVCNFILAVDRNYTSRDRGRQADFINCVAWQQTGEIIARYFAKGRRIGIVGNIQTRNWEDKNGQKRKETEVIVEEAHFVDDAPKNDNQPPQRQEEFMDAQDDTMLPFDW
jgi:single-strand DNA-binding protein